MGMCMLLRSDDTFVDYHPEAAKFNKAELEEAVGGDYYVVASDNSEHLFVVNKRNQTETLSYNINANYLYRRFVNGDEVLRGDVLLCHRELLEDADIA